MALSLRAGLVLALAFGVVDARVQDPVHLLLDVFPAADPCPRLEPLPAEACREILDAAVDSTADSPVDLEALETALADELTKPDFLNSALAKAFGGEVPLGLEFKELDGENGEPALALSYAIDYDLASKGVTADGAWNRRYALTFNATGTYTQDPLENPRDFLDTKLTASGARSTRIPEQSLEFGAQLTEAAVRNVACEGETSPECEGAADEVFALFDSTMSFLKAFRYQEFGLDAGLESDQEFDAKQRKFSAFFFSQYESWGSDSLLDTLNVTPAFRVGLDSISPNSLTPRALAGDDSSYMRFSGEVSLWIPLGARVPLALTFNYRHFREISPSDVVKNANLDSYDIRTLSLTGTNGLFVTYSSGRLPLDQQGDDVVELGWKTYF
ncbi:MAG TPA: hypothetical protein VKA43_03070 [Gammaproteobacteria bacterium]|nr:hypothetical protein [Gammaproteobacteria bacterium]